MTVKGIHGPEDPYQNGDSVIPELPRNPLHQTNPPSVTEIKTQDVALDVLNTGMGTSSQVVQPRKALSPAQDEWLEEGIAQVAAGATRERSAPATSEKPVSVHEKWVPFLREDMEQLSLEELQQKIRGRRSDIAAIKEIYRDNQRLAEALPEKIRKAKHHMEHLEGQLPKKRGGKRSRSKIHSLKVQLEVTAGRLSELEPQEQKLAFYRVSQETKNQVARLLEKGGMKPVAGGKSGVYFLCDATGQPKFVVKPLDEEALALNNPKGDALPYADSEGLVRPKAGIPLYQSVQNGALAFGIAKLIGVERITPRAEALLVQSAVFADITDNVTEGREALLAAVGPPDREKLCLVQEFAVDCEELGTVVLSNSRLTQHELMALDYEEQFAILSKATPDDINQEMYEECAILTWVIGEKDGNAGNYIVSREADPVSEKRAIYKIDNACSSPENNQALTSGLSWSLHNYDKPLSAAAREKIAKINIQEIASLMRLHGKSEQAIFEMRERVELLQYYAKNHSDYSIEELDCTWMFFFEPPEEVAGLSHEEREELTARLENVTDRIRKTQGHRDRLANNLKAKPGGKRARSRNQSIKQQIAIANDRLDELEKLRDELKRKLE